MDGFKNIDQSHGVFRFLKRSLYRGQPPLRRPGSEGRNLPLSRNVEHSRASAPDPPRWRVCGATGPYRKDRTESRNRAVCLSGFGSAYSSGILFQSLLKAGQRPCKVILVKHIGNAHLVAAERRIGIETRSGSHHHCSAVMTELAQAPNTEFLGIVNREARHSVESSVGHGAVNSGNTVQSFYEEIAPADVFFIHALQI